MARASTYLWELLRRFGAHDGGGQAERAMPELRAVLDGVSATVLIEQALVGAATFSKDERALAGEALWTQGGPLAAAVREGAVEIVSSACAADALAAACGLAATGMRATVFVDGSDVGALAEQLPRAVAEQLPLVVHLTAANPGLAGQAGHEAYHALADSGAVLFFATSVQEATDLTLIARAVAERAMLPVVVAMDVAETALSPQQVSLPSAQLIQAYLGTAADYVSTSTAAQKLLWGEKRRRLVPAVDLDRPLMRGAHLDGNTAAQVAAGADIFFAQHVPQIVDAACEELGKLTGRTHTSLATFATRGAELLLVAQGSTVQLATAVADWLSREKPKMRVGVVGVRCLRPTPDAGWAQAFEGAPRILVLERLSSPLSQRGPLTREISAALLTCGGNKRAQLRTAILGLGGAPISAADVAQACRQFSELADAPTYLGVRLTKGSATHPKRTVLADNLKRTYGDAAGRTLRARSPIDVRPAGAISLALHHAGGTTGEVLGALATALWQLVGGTVSGHKALAWQPDGERRDVLTWAKEGLAVAGWEAPCALQLISSEITANGHFSGKSTPTVLEIPHTQDLPELPAGTTVYTTAPVAGESAAQRKERLTGAVLAAFCDVAEVARPSPRKLMSAARERLSGLNDAEAELCATAFVQGFDGLVRAATTAGSQHKTPAAASQDEVPLALRHLLPANTQVSEQLDSLGRFWAHTGVLYERGETDALGLEPYLATGAMPPLSASFRSPKRSTLPRFVPEACTGCGACWAACPHSALAAAALSPKGILELGIKLAKARGATAEPLRMLLGKLANRIGKVAATTTPTSFGELLKPAFDDVVSRAGLAAEREADVRAACAALEAEVGKLPIARTPAFFDAPEGEAPGRGELLTVAVSPQACVGCGLCVAGCEASALLPDADATEARVSWQLFEELPDTRGETIARVEERADVDKVGATLLAQSCAFAMVGGDGAEAGSGPRLALRRYLGLAEAELQKRRQEQLAEVQKLEAKVQESIRAQLASALPAADLDGLARALTNEDAGTVSLADLAGRAGTKEEVDASRLAPLVDAARDLRQLAEALARGPFGLGRARLSLLLADTAVARGLTVFPYNPFSVPVLTSDGQKALAIARGILRGQQARYVRDVALLRRARLLLDNPLEAALKSDELEQLSWQELTFAERRLCPPLLLVASSELVGQRALVELLEPGLPVRLLLCADGPGELLSLSLASLGLGLAAPQLLVAQSSLAHTEHFFTSVKRALTYDGPSLVQVGAPSPWRSGLPADRTIALTRLQVRSRAWPLYLLDPEVEGVFGARLDVAANPELDAATYAEALAAWLLAEPRCRKQLAPLQDGTAALSLESLVGGEATDPERAVYVADADGRRLQLAAPLAAQVRQLLRSWRILQELAGVETPFTQSVREEAAQALTKEHNAALAALKAEYEQRLASAHADATRAAVTQLSARLVQLSSGRPVS